MREHHPLHGQVLQCVAHPAKRLHSVGEKAVARVEVHRVLADLYDFRPGVQSREMHLFRSGGIARKLARLGQQRHRHRHGGLGVDQWLQKRLRARRVLGIERLSRRGQCLGDWIRLRLVRRGPALGGQQRGR